MDIKTTLNRGYFIEKSTPIAAILDAWDEGNENDRDCLMSRRAPSTTKQGRTRLTQGLTTELDI